MNWGYAVAVPPGIKFFVASVSPKIWGHPKISYSAAPVGSCCTTLAPHLQLHLCLASLTLESLTLLSGKGSVNLPDEELDIVYSLCQTLLTVRSVHLEATN